MNQVLGRSCGNAVEVLEAVRFLQGSECDPRLGVVVRTLAAELLVMGRLEPNIRCGRGTRFQGARQWAGAGALRAHGGRVGRAGRLRRPCGRAPAGGAGEASAPRRPRGLGPERGHARAGPRLHRAGRRAPQGRRCGRPARGLHAGGRARRSRGGGQPACHRPCRKRVERRDGLQIARGGLRDGRRTPRILPRSSSRASGEGNHEPQGNPRSRRPCRATRASRGAARGKRCASRRRGIPRPAVSRRHGHAAHR
jgi:hypothetical protein